MKITRTGLKTRHYIPLLLLCSAFPLPSFAQIKTTISDTLVRGGGDAVSGTITAVNEQTFTSADGYVIPKGQKTTVTIGGNGAFTMQLIPNLGATPSGTWYDVSYRTLTSTVTETWIVPSSGSPVTLLMVRTLNPPAPALVIPFPQTIPPPSCTGLTNPVPVWTGTQWRCGNPNLGAVSMDLENPTGADSGKFEWKPKNTIRLTRISCSVDQGAASVNLDVRQESTPNVAGTQVLSVPLPCSTSTGATTAIANPDVTGLSPVALLITSASGGVSVVRVHAEYQLNP